jgi:hypothetical protein
MKIFIAPAGPNTYSVDLEDGPRLLNSTKLPFLDGARALLNLGHTGALEMWDYERPYPRMRGDIEKAAKLTVREDDRRFGFEPWKPSPFTK